MKIQFLGGITPQEFLNEYWEKKPLLIRGAVEDTESLASVDEIKELAFDEHFETRIVYNDKNKVKVKHGPLKSSDFDSSKWTFVCHNLNTISDDFHSLQEKVNFIPTFLFDDVMATYSKENSTIGAHIDKYNVFILQGSGKRLWRLQESPDPTYDETKELKILKNFNPTIEWLLEPGDMIYIPSSVAHEGFTVEESISYSIGFKSLEDQVIIDHFLTDCLENIETEDYLKLHNLEHQEDSSLISKKIVCKIEDQIKKNFLESNFIKNWIISHLSKPKESIDPGTIYLEEEILEISKDSAIFKDTLTRFNSYQEEDDYILSINKDLYRLSAHHYKLVSTWFKKPFGEEINIDFKKLDYETWPLLIDLFKKGTFYFSQTEEPLSS